MSIVFADREASFPHKYKVIPDDGSEPYFIVLERADEPLTPGTPLNAETFNNMIEDYERLSKENADALTTHKENQENPHKVTAYQVGLGRVPNVPTDEQTPNHEEPEELSPLAGGEMLKIAMGKLAVAVRSLIDHLANKSNPHAVTAAQAGAVPTTRKVNNKGLGADITLTAADVEALNEVAVYYGPSTNKSADDLTDAFAVIPLSASLNGQLYSLLSGTFAYVITLFYGSTATTQPRMQIAFSYNTTYPTMAVRAHRSSGWLSWVRIADLNDFANYKCNTFSGLSDIGLTVGSETIAGIATNLPNNAILVLPVTTSNASIYPSNYGLLTVTRTSGARISFEFVNTSGVVYSAFYSINSGGDTWSGWKKLASSTETWTFTLEDGSTVEKAVYVG